MTDTHTRHKQQLQLSLRLLTVWLYKTLCVFLTSSFADVLSKHVIFHIIITQTVPAAVPVSTVDSEQHAIRLTSYTHSHTQELLELVFVSCV